MIYAGFAAKETMGMSEFSRRRFLQTGSGLAMSAVLPGAMVLGEEQAQSVASGDRVRFASIGVGIQGSSLLRAAVTLPQAQCVAACDLYDGRHTLAKEIAGQNIKTTRRYQEILEDKDIEAVIVAVPDHWHKQVTVDARGRMCTARSRWRIRSPRGRRWLRR
jgi:FlaA1/EpsC-like NDP-sugar epimerase